VGYKNSRTENPNAENEIKVPRHIRISFFIVTRVVNDKKICTVYLFSFYLFSMTFQLPALAYAYDALEPIIDARTMEIHHSKHHQAYVDNLNKAID
jgi:hypothetical protein